jgi:LPXTG-site transpeptidase (sortase) family protein
LVKANGTLLWWFFILAGLVEGTLTARIWRRAHPTLPPPAVIQKEENLPQKLRIPKLGLAATVEAVGLGSDGEMVMPENPQIAAWYRSGSKLGEKGNLVIAGHLDSKTGPAVFYRLAQLTAGDKITITDQNNQEFLFIVVKKETYDEDQFPVNEVFGSSDRPRLNLITCRGRFDRATKRYTKRVVVFSELKEQKTSPAPDGKTP